MFSEIEFRGSLGGFLHIDIGVRRESCFCLDRSGSGILEKHRVIIGFALCVWRVGLITGHLILPPIYLLSCLRFVLFLESNTTSQSAYCSAKQFKGYSNTKVFHQNLETNMSNQNTVECKKPFSKYSLTTLNSVENHF